MVQYVTTVPREAMQALVRVQAHMLARIVVEILAADIACRVGMAILEYGPYGYRRCAIVSCDVVYADKITPRVYGTSWYQLVSLWYRVHVYLPWYIPMLTTPTCVPVAPERLYFKLFLR